MLKKLLFVTLAFLAVCYNTKASSISEQTAKTIALNFYNVNIPAGHTTYSAALNYTSIESDGTIDFYVFNISPVKGFVIVSGTDNVIPVLAYSTESNFDANFSQTGVSDWVKHASAKIHYAVTNQIMADAHVQDLWTAYLNGQNPNGSKSVAVGPLVKTTWNQEPYYNSLCPVDVATSAHAVTGCVATAMAQIMKYWSYPPKGAGSYSYNDSPPLYSNTYGTQSANFGATTYNWAAMGNYASNNTSPIDSLMYQCGVAVAMDYGTDAQGGSGAFVLQSETGPGNPCAQYAFVNYFLYNPNTIQGVRQSSYSVTDWLNLMRSELNAGRVIEYEGDDPTAGGHTWVCDGYDNNNMLHMNWGWGGSANGYFAPTNLNAGGYNFSQNDAALIGIQPIYPFAASVSADNTTICAGSNATISAQGPAGATYSWVPTTGLACPTCAATFASPATTTLYTVTIDSAGVTAQMSLAIVIAQPVAANFTVKTASSCTLPQSVSFANASNNALSYLWDFGDGTTDTISSPVHAFNAYGNYTVKLLGANACYVDSITKVKAAQIVDKAPLSADQNICSGQTVTLNAVDTFGTINWYDAPNGGNLVTTGNTYTTPALNNTTIYYADATITSAPTKVGARDTTIGQGSVYTHTTQRGLVFNSTEVQTLISVDVFSDSAGSRTIVLLDSSGATLNSATVNVGKGKQTVQLNFALPVGYHLKLEIGGFNFLHRNLSGASYPYTSGDGNLVITGNTSNSPTGYYYFYNWQLQPSPCVTGRTIIPVFVLNTSGVSFTATGNYSQVNFVPADTSATSYSWDFGDGITSTQVSPVHAYGSDGVFTVQLIISNGSCTDTVTQALNTVALGINNITLLQNMVVSPNPAKNTLTINISGNQPADNCSLSISDIMGRQISKRSIGLDEGVNTFNYNIESFSSGVYFISLQNGAEVITRRFVKE